jgi:hypothetical protein
MEREIPAKELSDSWLELMKKKHQVSKKALDMIKESEEGSQCTYPKGYLGQEVYHCKTCKNLERPNGVCLACYLNCHLDHEVVEVGYKPNFRCDCGTGRIKSACKLVHDKTENFKNVYNHNFEGRFCICDEPDNEETRDDEMYMCSGCYDWFHEKCIKTSNDSHNFAPPNLHQKRLPAVPRDVENYMLLCKACISKVLFLPSAYSDFISLEEIELPTKRNREDSSDCPVKNSVLLDGYPYHTFIHKSWLVSKCECEDCLPLYNSDSIKQILSDDLKPSLIDKIEEEAEKIFSSKSEEIRENEDEDHADIMNSVPPNLRVEVAEGVNLFRETLQDFLENLGSEVCSVQQIERFKEILYSRYEAYKQTKYY